MIRISAIAVVALLAAGVWAQTPGTAASPFTASAPCTPRGQIDVLVFRQLEQMGIAPADVCSDAVFLRRAGLDVTGTLPTAEEARAFLADKDPNKRSVLIDRLLGRTEYADYWAMKWSDWLRVKAEFPINLWPNAAQAYYHWIHTSIKDNLPYDKFARQLLTSSGSNFRVAPVNFYRALQGHDPQAIAQAVSLTFLGCRADKTPKAQTEALSACFSRVGYKHTKEWKEEIVFFDQAKPPGPSTAAMPDGRVLSLAADRDPREAFADWLIEPNNTGFTRAIVNRIWGSLQGRGIVHEIDDIRPDNPPSNPELLTYLQRELVASGYDIKQLCRLILNSQTYQLSSIPRSKDPRAVAHFASYPLRRLDAEVLVDALNQITGATEEYSSEIPEPFTFLPKDTRSIALPDGSITSSFLEMFGRPPRDTGQESERNSGVSAEQRLHFLNSSHVQRKIQQSGKLRGLLQGGKLPAENLTSLYLTILSRYPTKDEMRAAADYAKSAETTGPEVVYDMIWALINSSEFMYRH